MIHHIIDQNSDEWYKLRCGKVTASQFKIAFSSESSKGYNDLIYTKRAEIRTGEVEDSFKSKWMERGAELEPVARNAYEIYTFEKVSDAGFWEHSEYIGASPDGLINNNGLVEFKCPKASTMERYRDKNVLPNEYKLQVHGQMMCTGRDWVDFVAFHPSYELFIHRVYRDEEIISEIEEKLNKLIKKIIWKQHLRS